MTPPRHCTAPGCGKLLVPHPKEGRRFDMRQSCNRVCQRLKRLATRRAWAKTQNTKEPVEKPSPGGWPYVTGPVEADFRPHDIEPGIEYGSTPLRPGTLVKTQSSIA